MSRPKLPSELHPDYPRATRSVDDRGVTTITSRSIESLQAFWKAHPEFDNEGEWVFVCPYCGEPNKHEDHGGMCCGEYGHCEWVYFDVNGNEAEAPE